MPKFTTKFLILFFILLSTACASKQTPPIDKEAVRLTIRHSIKDFRNCYRKELKAKTIDTKKSYRVTLVWNIVDKGKAIDVKIQKGSVNKTLDECLIKTMSSLTFPEPPSSVKAKVIYPFIFSSYENKGNKLKKRLEKQGY